MIKLKKLLLEDETGLGSKVASASSSAKGYAGRIGSSVKNYSPKQGFFKSFGELKSKYDKLGAMFMYWFVEALNVALTVNLRAKTIVSDPGGDSNGEELKKVFEDANELIKKTIKFIIDKHVSEQMADNSEDHYKESKSKTARTTITSARGQDVYLKIKKINYLPQLEALLKQLIYDGNESVYAFIANKGAEPKQGETGTKNPAANTNANTSSNTEIYQVTEKNVLNVIYKTLQPHIIEAMKTLQKTPEWKDLSNTYHGNRSGMANRSRSTLKSFDGDVMYKNWLISSKQNNGVAGFLYCYALANAVKKALQSDMKSYIVRQTGTKEYRNIGEYDDQFSQDSDQFRKFVFRNLNKNIEIIRNDNPKISDELSHISGKTYLSNFMNFFVYKNTGSIFEVSATELSKDGVIRVSNPNGIINLIYSNLLTPTNNIINIMKADELFDESNIKF